MKTPEIRYQPVLRSGFATEGGKSDIRGRYRQVGWVASLNPTYVSKTLGDLIIIFACPAIALATANVLRGKIWSL